MVQPVARKNSVRLPNQQDTVPVENLEAYEQPSVLEGYLALDGIFEKGSFTRVERQLILLAASD